MAEALTLTPHEIEAATLRAVAQFAATCEEAGHELCLPYGNCGLVADALRDRVEFDAAARRYDAGGQGAWSEFDQPTPALPTAALFRLVSDLLIGEPPWTPRQLWRTVWLTTALAALGERGIPADAVVRTCLGSALKRRMILELSRGQMAVHQGQVCVDQLPWQLQDWLSILPTADNYADLVIASLTGRAGAEIDRWVNLSAVSHLIAWRRDSEPVDLFPEDRVLTGGSDATQWVFDRFTHTALDDWARSSLDWELAYTSDSPGIAQAAGISASVIAERPVSQQMVVSAIARRIRTPSVADPVVAGLNARDLMDNLIGLTLRGERSEALQLARRAADIQPGNGPIALAVGFLLIPDNCDQAQRRLRALSGHRGVAADILAANLATCAIRRGLAADVSDTLHALAASSYSSDAWLWTPDTLADPEPTLGQTAVAQWAAKLLDLVA